ncbi:perlucin-like protein [Ostrea edulis]|uniref:perlucin-like protein n=1 Tax=Ostrea edulis TaxID=37623 RepID=UPI0024AFE54D|nr:perlucin-like protein [Ostrea edulis]
MGGLYLLVFVIILGVHESLSRCPLGWYHHGNSCLLFSTDTLNWNDSSEACASVGASLVAIESHEEETFIQNRLHHEFASFMFWLGGTDQFQSDSVWYWISTEQAINDGYTDWHATEPDHPGKQHCLAMRKDLNYQWCDDYCPELHAYICEKPLDDGQSIIG